jgi:uncharacterized membrane protein YkvA (DUF1232 family)
MGRLLQFRTELMMLWRAFVASETPIWLKGLMLLVPLYLISPIDLIPDFIPLAGWLDDLVVIPLLVSWIVSLLPHETDRRTTGGDGSTIIDGDYRRLQARKGDLGAAVRELKARVEGTMSVAGTKLGQSLGEIGLIDEYRLYMHPVVLGSGKPYFAGKLPPLRFVASDRMDENVIRLTYALAEAPAPSASLSSA